MNEDPQQDTGEGAVSESEEPQAASQGEPPGRQSQPSEEELRAQLEEELRKVRVQDLLLQSVASLVNLTARRIAKEDERDLEQGRIGIEAIRALTELLDPEPQKQVRSALSELQMLFARASGGGGGEGAGGDPGGGASAPGGGSAAGGATPGGGGPGPPRRPGGSGLWTPPGTRSS